MSASLDYSVGSGVSCDFGDVTTFDGLAALSISAWFYRDTSSSGDCIVGKWDVLNTSWAFLFECDASNNLDFLVADGVGPNIDWINSASTFSTGVWNFVTVTWEGGGSNTMNIFVNGSDDTGSRSDAGTGAGATIPNTSAKFTVGTRSNGDSGLCFDGKIGHVLVHGKLLSLDEHKELMYNPNGVLDSIYTWAPGFDGTGRDYVQNTTPTLNGNVSNSALGAGIHMFSVM